MKLRTHQATISFCPDLLNPEGSETIPVGVLVLGEAANLAVALLTVDSNPCLPESLPAVVREIVADFPQLVRAQLEEILRSDSGASIDRIMDSFEDSLRNSFFVSDLKLNQEIEVQAPKSAHPVDPAWLYAPTTSLASATVARSFSKPVWTDTATHYRPWLLDAGAGSRRHAGQ